MAALRFLLLLAALAPWACALTSQPAPLFQNLSLEPALLRLSWDGYVTSGSRDVVCQKGMKTRVRADPHSTHCRFPSLSLCHVTDLCVFRVRDLSLPSCIRFPEPDPDCACMRFPESDPDRASAATNLSCWVHDVDVMTCRWGRGPAAPEDAQYWMFWRDASLGRDRDRECAHYDLADSRGSRLGCRVDGVAALPPYVTVTVTGGGGASCSDVSVLLQRAEVLTPPALTAACNGTEAAQLHWEMRSHFHRTFVYELLIQKSSRSEPEIQETSENHIRVVNPGSAHFRVRARPTSNTEFSDWSPAVPLDCDPDAGTGSRVTVMAAALAVLGAGLTALGTLLLCRRPLRAKLFPAIPRAKDLGRGAETETVAWAAAPEDPEVTRVTEA
ncbi:interleukin-3 receptor subunit alpha-like [Microtus pennsylvanicus]|uniref:interleukin-3 receptor subunit alpha-like n=1 Tax=Microtus pennsylvanicus TaxID=10058 RepID=UPI003F6D6194